MSSDERIDFNCTAPDVPETELDESMGAKLLMLAFMLKKGNKVRNDFEEAFANTMAQNLKITTDRVQIQKINFCRPGLEIEITNPLAEKLAALVDGLNPLEVLAAEATAGAEGVAGDIAVVIEGADDEEPQLWILSKKIRKAKKHMLIYDNTIFPENYVKDKKGNTKPPKVTGQVTQSGLFNRGGTRIVIQEERMVEWPGWNAGGSSERMVCNIGKNQWVFWNANNGDDAWEETGTTACHESCINFIELLLTIYTFGLYLVLKALVMIVPTIKAKIEAKKAEIAAKIEEEKAKVEAQLAEAQAAAAEAQEAAQAAAAEAQEAASAAAAAAAAAGAEAAGAVAGATGLAVGAEVAVLCAEIMEALEALKEFKELCKRKQFVRHMSLAPSHIISGVC